MTCKISPCANTPVLARGMCSTHYSRWRRGTDMAKPPKVWAPAADRIHQRLDKTGDCWLWTGDTTSNGYGRIRDNGRSVLVHRVTWEEANGPIPADLEVDHLCRVRACANPDHLELVTHRENMRRSSMSFDFDGLCRAGRHSMADPQNVYTPPDGQRECRACARQRRLDRARGGQEASQ